MEDMDCLFFFLQKISLCLWMSMVESLTPVAHVWGMLQLLYNLVTQVVGGQIHSLSLSNIKICQGGALRAVGKILAVNWTVKVFFLLQYQPTLQVTFLFASSPP